MEEVHNLKHNAELSRRFFLETLNAYYFEDGWTKNSHYYVKDYIHKYISSLRDNDFESWKELVLEIIDKSSDSISLESEFMDEFACKVFFENDPLIAGTEFEVYNQIMNECFELTSSQ